MLGTRWLKLFIQRAGKIPLVISDECFPESSRNKSLLVLMKGRHNLVRNLSLLGLDPESDLHLEIIRLVTNRAFTSLEGCRIEIDDLITNDI